MASVMIDRHFPHAPASVPGGEGLLTRADRVQQIAPGLPVIGPPHQHHPPGERTRDIVAHEVPELGELELPIIIVLTPRSQQTDRGHGP